MKLKNFLKKNWKIILILVFALALRTFKLGSNPVSLDWDEASLGYNAFSILETGRDEYGKLFPLIFKSFGDYKPGLYVYLTVPFIFLFGLTEFAVRVTSALAGVITVFAIFKLVSLFFKNKNLGLLSALVLCANPWHIHFSRGAWEANVALLFIVLGIYFFIKGLAKKKLVLAAVFFGLSFLTYQGAKMMVPLILLGLLVFYFEKIKTLKKKDLFLPLILFALISMPIFLSLFSKSASRLKVMSVASHRRPIEITEEILRQVGGNKIAFGIYENEGIAILRGALGRYFNHFSGKFLFFEGDWSNQRHSAGYIGVLYYFDLIFLLLGIMSLFKATGRQKYFLCFWLLISPLPAALSRDAIQGIRSLNMVIPLTVIVSFGIYNFLHWLKTQRKIIIIGFSVTLGIACLWNFVYYLDQYYVHYPQKSSEYWQYGYKEVVNKVYPIHGKYVRTVFTQKWGQPYIYWLFYTKYDPRVYQLQANLVENSFGDVGKVERIDNIEFRDVYWPSDRGLGKSLFIGAPYELPEHDIDSSQAKIIDDVKFLNGNLSFRIVETY